MLGMNKRADKKEALLCAGISVMHAQGYNGTSVKDIVDAASVPKGSFYNYFDSKEGFALDAIEHVANQRDLAVDAVLKDQSREPAERIKALYSGCIDTARCEAFKKGCFLGNLCQEMADTSDAIRRALRLKMCEFNASLTDVVKEAQASGHMQFAEAPVIAQMIANGWEGALMRSKAAQSKEPMDAFLAMLDHLISG